MGIAVAEFTIEAFKPYTEAQRKLEQLEVQLVDIRDNHTVLTRQAEIVENEAIRAEAAVMIDEGSEQTALAARKKADAARTKVVDARRKVDVLGAAIVMQRAKVAELLPAAKQHIQQTAKSVHQPIVSRLLSTLKEYAAARREHEQIISSVADSLGGLYGSLLTPNGPDARTTDDWVASIERQMREQGYE